MAVLEQFLTKTSWLIGLGLVLVLASCQQSRPDSSIPAVLEEVQYHQDSFFTKKGVLYKASGGERFSGVLTTTHPNGQVGSKEQYVNGLKEGMCESWYPDGKIYYKRSYSKGMKSGKHLSYYPNGQVKQEANLLNDYYHGNVKEWYDNGQLYRDFNFENGHESGAQRMWKSDGRVKANYVVRNGRRYGLTGVKNCVNVFEEE